MLKYIIFILFMCPPIFCKGGWILTYGKDEKDGGNSVLQTPDGGYILVGYTQSFGNGGNDVWLIKADSDGNRKWDKFYGGRGSDVGQVIINATDGGYIILGETNSFGSGLNNIWLMKMNTKGEEEWRKTFGGEEFENGFAIQPTNDGGYIITGYTYSFENGSSDVWLIKTDPLGNTVDWE